ncbi:MAG: GNAT family N-acetyltransferase [Thermoleophilia bacterium]|nr:GNAT family N-acetyltransferase [Thermoleophilia bacterium]
MIDLVRRLSDEPESNLEISPGEFTLTAAEEREILTEHSLSENSVYLVAESEGEIVGILTCKGRDRQAIRHTVTLGISVERTWRGRGVGSQLMAHAIDWAKRTGMVSRIELSVFERNETAIHLYRKFGFEVEGRRCRAIFRDGEYLNDVIMALLL